MPYSDPEKQKEYQRNWLKQRREKYFSNKFCINCGSKENLELDHIDRTKKVTHRIWSFSENKRKEELSKCQVLCKTCHQIKSSEECKKLFTKELIHGTKSGYQKGCRCSDCHKALLQYWRDRRNN